MNKSFSFFAVLLVLVAIAVAATRAPQGEFKNLKILPKDISVEKMDSIMESYNKALGIGCSFCHAPHPTIQDSLDYASDRNEMKAEARKMMNLTIDLNQKYFYYDTTVPPVYLNLVRCQTCHRGDPYPVE
ncbi:MAG: c-type cytochrome [Chitinophagaceae bacterium]|nr:c-type cytochrome [Chitinophagaceae bacterium]